MVGDVGHEVGVAAVGLAHHAVLVVAVVRGAQPQRAVLLVGLAARDQRFHHRVYLAVGVQARFEGVDVELHAEGLQVGVLLLAQSGHREFAHRLEIVGLAAARGEVARDFLDVLAAVAVRRPAGRLGLESLCARLHREGEVLDLRARVVVIELARDCVALRFEQRGDGVAERCLPPVADVQRAGGVGGDEFDHHLFRTRISCVAVLLLLLKDLADDLLFGRLLEADIKKPCTG